MASVKRLELEAWLARRGFARVPGGPSSHRHYEGHGIKVTVPGHGPHDMVRGTVSGIKRQLRSAGVNVDDFPGGR